MDTPLVNGTAYPTSTVKPSAYRFQVLSAGNDRTWNLGLYYAAVPPAEHSEGRRGKGPQHLHRGVHGVRRFRTWCAPVTWTTTASATEAPRRPPGCFPNPAGPILATCATASQFGGGGLVQGDIVSAGFDHVTGLPLQKGKPCWPTDLAHRWPGGRSARSRPPPVRPSSRSAPREACCPARW